MRTLVLALVALSFLATPASGAGDVYIRCLNHSGTESIRKTHPKSCLSFGRDGSFAGGVNLAKLHWSNWGSRTARATGIEKGFHLPFDHIPVKVKAYRKKRGCGGVIVYTRLRATSRHGTSTVFLKPC